MPVPDRGSAGRGPRDRGRPAAGRAVLRPAARRPRGRGHQDRAARRAATRCASGAGRSRTGSRCGGRWSPATRSRSPSTCARPEGQELRPPAGRGQRRADRELPARHAGTLEPRLRRARRDQPAARAHPGHRLRPDRPVRRRGPGSARSARRWAACGTSPGEPDRPPARAGISIGDSLAATYACIGTLAALQERQRSGRGQVVDSAIYEAVLAMMESLVTEWQVAGYQRERTGAILPNVAPSNVYPTADGGSVLIAANQDSVFRRLPPRWVSRSWPTTRGTPRHGARGEQHGRAGRADRGAGRPGTTPTRCCPLLDARGRAGRAHLPRRRTCWPTRT